MGVGMTLQETTCLAALLAFAYTKFPLENTQVSIAAGRRCETMFTGLHCDHRRDAA
jgi:hypothetical protein